MLSIMSTAASIDGYLPFLAACHCSYCAIVIVCFFTRIINAVLFCTSHHKWWRDSLVVSVLD